MRRKSYSYGDTADVTGYLGTSGGIDSDGFYFILKEGHGAAILRCAQQFGNAPNVIG
jgi:hypothetical protein